MIEVLDRNIDACIICSCTPFDPAVVTARSDLRSVNNRTTVGVKAPVNATLLTGTNNLRSVSEADEVGAGTQIIVWTCRVGARCSTLDDAALSPGVCSFEALIPARLVASPQPRPVASSQ